MNDATPFVVVVSGSGDNDLEGLVGELVAQAVDENAERIEHAHDEAYISAWYKFRILHDGLRFVDGFIVIGNLVVDQAHSLFWVNKHPGQSSGVS
jgi:hypothetical protein